MNNVTMHGSRGIVRHVSRAVKRYFDMAPNNTEQYGTTCKSQVPKQLDLEVNRIVWIDMEMTGLNVEKDRIMEVACLVTDSDLNIIAEGPDIVIHQDESLLNNMTEWCKHQHGKSGLTEACLKSQMTEEQAEKSLMEFLFEHVTENVSPLAGNSVYMDRLFLLKYLPEVHNYLHYRIIDVSTIKELCRRWNPEITKCVPKKEFCHRAYEDIKESIAELKYYKQTFFKTL